MHKPYLRFHSVIKISKQLLEICRLNLLFNGRRGDAVGQNGRSIEIDISLWNLTLYSFICSGIAECCQFEELHLCYVKGHNTANPCSFGG